MKQYEKEVVQYQLNQEKAVLKRLERQYTQALQDITHKINTLSSTIEMLQNAGNSDEFALSQARAKAYQRDYQEALKGQISGVLDKLHADEFESIQDYLNACYADGFIGAMYQMHAQDVPIIVPIDQGAEVQAIQLETKLKNPLYEALAGGMDGMKKAIQSELTRGIAMGLGWDETARNLSNTTKAPLAHAKTIARTEGHRIQEKAAYDAFQKAKNRGADVLKQWDSTLDGKTRDSHRRVDGELREDGKKFSNGLMYPGDPDGEAEEVVNCRCTMLPRARWALDEDELKTLQERAKYFGLENNKKKLQDFEEFKKNYLKAVEFYRRKTAEDGHQIIDKPTYQKLTNNFVKNGGIIIRGKEAERHLKDRAYAAYLPGFNSAYIRDDATISDVLEEMYHAEQDKKNKFGSVLTDEVRIKREIDAQNYLLSLTERYKIPSEEVELTRKNLAYYEKELKRLLEGGKQNDE